MIDVAVPTPEVIAANRVKALAALRAETRGKARGILYSEKSKCYCALGYMGLAVGLDAAKESEYHFGMEFNINKALGITSMESMKVAELSDLNELTLAEIADFIETYIF